MKRKRLIIVSGLRRCIVLLLIVLTGHLSASAVYLMIGEQHTFSVTAPNGGNVTSGSWYSDNAAVTVLGNTSSCTVYPNAYFSGTATIHGNFTYNYQVKENGKYTTKRGTFSESFTVTCAKPSVSLSPSTKTVNAGKEVDLTVSISNVMSSQSLFATWSYSDMDVAYIHSAPNHLYSSETVTVKTYKAGTCTITVDIGNGITASSKITVKDANPTGMSVYPSTASLAIGETRQLSCSFTPSDATSDITWSTSASSVATVNSSGLVTAKGEGTATITAKSANGLSSSCEVTVYKPVVTSIKLSQSTMTLPVGDSQKLTYTVTPANALYSVSVSWSTNNNSVATVSGLGLVTAIAPGTARITVKTENGRTDQCVVTVPAVPKSISLPSDLTLSLHQQYQLTCSVSPSNAMTSFTWSSSDTEIVSVTEDGLLTALGVGEAVVTATSNNGLTATCHVTVTPPKYELVVLTKDSQKTVFDFAEKPKITIKGTKFAVASTAKSVEYEAKNIRKVTLEDAYLIKAGDVNGDRTVDVADIATVITVMANGSGIANPLQQDADVNGDGTVDVADIATIITIMAQ